MPADPSCPPEPDAPAGGPAIPPGAAAPPRTLRPREWVAWLAAALALRLAYGWILHPRWAGAFGWAGDDGYDEIARLWLGGRGYVRWEGGPPTLERLPLYPAFLALFFGAAGARGEALAHLAQCLLSTLSLLPLGSLASRLGGARACRAALALGLLHPLGYVYNFRFMTEPLHLLLVAVFVWLAARCAEAGGVARAAACGAALGAALLTRSSLAPIAPALLIVMALARQREARPETPARADPKVGPRGASGGSAESGPGSAPARLLLAAALACAAVVAPWLARARGLGGGLISSGSAAAVYHGLAVSRAAWQTARLGEVDRGSDQALEAHLRRTLPGLRPEEPRWEAERQRVAWRLAAEAFRDDPALRLAEFLRNLALAWYLTYTPKGTAVAALVQVPLLVALAVGLRRRGRRWPPALWPLLGLVAALSLQQALVYPHFRFMSPATWAALAVAAGACAGGGGDGRGRARSVA